MRHTGDRFAISTKNGIDSVLAINQIGKGVRVADERKAALLYALKYSETSTHKWNASQINENVVSVLT